MSEDTNYTELDLVEIARAFWDHPRTKEVVQQAERDGKYPPQAVLDDFHATEVPSTALDREDVQFILGYFAGRHDAP